MAKQDDRPIPTLSLRPNRPGVAGIRGIRKNAAYFALALIAGLIATALVIGLSGGSSKRQTQREVDIGFHEAKPTQLGGLPSTYAEIPSKPLPTTLPQDDGCPDCDSEQPRIDTNQLDQLQTQNTQLRRQVMELSLAIDQIGIENQKLVDQISRIHEQTQAEQAKAWGSALFFDIDDSVMQDTTKVHLDPHKLNSDTQLGDGLPDELSVPPTTSTVIDKPEQVRQDDKQAFFEQARSPRSHLIQTLLSPRSPYEIQAGTVIPAALLTGINTDLPGDVIAAVTSPVYDTVTGQHLLIPQGAKLYGAYDSQIANGQNRALLVWHRLLLPNGRSIQLDRMRGTDAAGYAGVADRVDYHTRKLFMGALLSTAIAHSGNLARSDSPLSDNDVGDTIAQEGSKLGSSIIDRQLDVQPTITIRPGWPLRVLVNQDVVLAPYRS